MPLTGIPKVIANVKQEIAAFKRRAIPAMIKVAIHLRDDMDKVPPLIPIDLGNLRGSFFWSPFPEVPRLAFGFQANYAFWVHENVTAVNWSRPGSGAKFMEAAMKRNEPLALKMMAEVMKVR